MLISTKAIDSKQVVNSILYQHKNNRKVIKENSQYYEDEPTLHVFATHHSNGSQNHRLTATRKQSTKTLIQFKRLRLQLNAVLHNQA